MSDYEHDVLMINNLRKKKEYGKFLYIFASVFYKESTFTNQVATEDLSSVLTPSDKAFLLLLIVVYYEETKDSEIVAKHPEKIFVTCSGWQQAGIDLYNELYVKVKEDRAIIGEAFDIYFCKMINESIRTYQNASFHIIFHAYQFMESEMYTSHNCPVQ